MPCPCCGGACCYPEMEACTELGDPCGEEGDPACPEGFTCVGGICERLSVTPIGDCPGTVQGPIAASCVDGLTQSACETGGGTYHPGQTCEQTCCGPCDEENPCAEGCACVDGECVPDSGACCTCNTFDSWAYQPGGMLQVFCDQAEAEAARAALLGEWLGRATAAADALSAAGWTCTTPDASVFYDEVENWNGDSLENPACDPEALVYRLSEDFWTVGARCCGTVDAEGEPIDLGDGQQAYPCVGPYTYDVCTDGVAAEACCGVHHPGQPCADEPCVTCEDFPLLGDEAYVDAYCENAASTVDFHGGQCVGQIAICGARTLVNDYGGGFGDWIVNICCANPLP